MPDTRSLLYLQGVNHDQHIPVCYGGVITPQDAVLAQTGYQTPDFAHVAWFVPAALGHRRGCFCCSARGAAASALAQLFRARATGQCLFFRRVVVLASEAGWAEIREALAQDALTRARFTLATDSSR